MPEILEAILKFFPLDPYLENPVSLMAVVEGDTVKPVIWKEYKKAHAVIATSEAALYANIILKKGVVVE